MTRGFVQEGNTSASATTAAKKERVDALSIGDISTKRSLTACNIIGLDVVMLGSDRGVSLTRSLPLFRAGLGLPVVGR